MSHEGRYTLKKLKMPDNESSAKSTPQKRSGQKGSASKETTRAVTAGTRKNDPEEIDVDDVQANLSPLKLSQQNKIQKSKLKKIPE